MNIHLCVLAVLKLEWFRKAVVS